MIDVIWTFDCMFATTAESYRDSAGYVKVYPLVLAKLYSKLMVRLDSPKPSTTYSVIWRSLAETLVTVFQINFWTKSLFKS